MTYDFWVGRRGHRFDGTRFTLQEIFLSSLTNFLYDDGRAPAGRAVVLGRCRRSAPSREWSNRIELLAMVEDTMDGRFDLVPPQGGGVRPNAGPVVVGTFSYKFSEQSLRVRELADRAMAQVGERRGLAQLPEAHRDPGRLRRASAGRLPDGRLAGPRRGRTTAARPSATRACSAWTRP